MPGLMGGTPALTPSTLIRASLERVEPQGLMVAKSAVKS